MVLPPLEYDHPDDGGVWILRGNAEQILRMCPKPKIPGNVILGCAVLKGGDCYIVIANDDVIKKTGLSYRLVLRHEQHCVGWPNDHAGACLATDNDW